VSALGGPPQPSIMPHKRVERFSLPGRHAWWCTCRPLLVVKARFFPQHSWGSQQLGSESAALHRRCVGARCGSDPAPDSPDVQRHPLAPSAQTPPRRLPRRPERPICSAGWAISANVNASAASCASSVCSAISVPPSNDGRGVQPAAPPAQAAARWGSLRWCRRLRGGPAAAPLPRARPEAGSVACSRGFFLREA